MTTSAPVTGLPPQVAPPGFALSRPGPHAVLGVDVVALPVLTGEGDDASPLLGPGAEELAAGPVEQLAPLRPLRVFHPAGEAEAGAGQQPDTVAPVPAVNGPKVIAPEFAVSMMEEPLSAGVLSKVKTPATVR